MKCKWIVEYWDNYIDALKRIGCHSYEEAITLQHKARSKGHSNVQIFLR